MLTRSGSTKGKSKQTSFGIGEIKGVIKRSYYQVRARSWQRDNILNLAKKNKTTKDKPMIAELGKRRHTPAGP